MRDLKQRLGRSYARFATNVAVRYPRLWPLVRPLVRKQFDVLAAQAEEVRSFSTQVSADAVKPAKEQLTRGMNRLRKAG